MFLMDGQPFKKIFNRFLPQVDKSWLARVPKLDEKIVLENLKHLPKFKDWTQLQHGCKLDKVKVVSEDDANEPFDYDSYTQIRFQSKKVDGVEKDTLILFFHGGGFIAMSSGTYQKESRIWAK